MKKMYRDFLFSKYILVGSFAASPTDIWSEEDQFCIIVTLAGKFGIRLKGPLGIVNKQMIQDVADNLGEYIPEPFYLGFPDSVRELTSEQKLFDQLYHYTQTYGLGWFDQVGHSALEEIHEKLKFQEKTEPKEFRILTEKEAENELKSIVQDILSGSRPLNPNQRTIVIEGYHDFGKDILPEKIPCKQTVVELLCDTKDVDFFGKFLKLPDVIKVLNYIQYNHYYGNENLKKLNLRNQDRKLLTKLLDHLFLQSGRNGWHDEIVECFEKQQIWQGLLHHLHYKPVNREAEVFLSAIRSNKNHSYLACFEKHMQDESRPNHIAYAAGALQSGKGTGAVLRNLNYILSRCKTDKEVESVLKLLGTDADPAILVSLLIRYFDPEEKDARTFLFTRNNQMIMHRETEEEVNKRKSYVSEEIRKAAELRIRLLLQDRLEGKLSGKKVWIDHRMTKIAVPIQMSTGNAGFDVLPTGSRIPIPEGKKIRAFTYWEKVNDIDLSCFGLAEDGQTQEFSWRSMCSVYGSNGILFSGDETSGYNGGSEYFDIELDKVKAQYPEFRYIVFCDNVYSGIPFDQCFAKAGFMMRDEKDSGEIYEPKTVATSFRITGDSTYAWMFALDLKTREMVWLNVTRKGRQRIAGCDRVSAVEKWLNVTDAINVESLYIAASDCFAASPEEADIVVTVDNGYSPKEGQEVVRPCDFEKILKLMR